MEVVLLSEALKLNATLTELDLGSMQSDEQQKKTSLETMILDRQWYWR